MDLKQVASIENEIISGGVEGVNGVAQLLDAFEIAMEHDEDEESDYDSDDASKVHAAPALGLLHALRRSFTSILERGSLQFKESKDASENDALKSFVNWIKSKYIDFMSSLSRLLTHQRAVYQVAALRTIMHFVQRDGLMHSEGTKRFGIEMYALMLRTIICAKGNMMTENLGRVLINEYIESYQDVRYYTLVCIRRICYMRMSVNMDHTSSEEDDDIQNSGVTTLHVSSVNNMPLIEFCESILALLSHVPACLDSEADELQLWVNLEKFSNKKKSKKIQVRAFQDGWIAFFLLPGIPESISRKVLLLLPDDVLPFLSNPLLLSDFLTDAYNMGGSIAMMALSSLFKLMSEHGLDYPDFYPKLYALLNVDVFHSKYRAKFFELLETFLASTHLSSYLVAAFAKKLCRLSLVASPGSAMFVIVFISNLLKRHPSCLFLVNRPTERELAMEKGDIGKDNLDINEAKRSKLDAIKNASLQIAMGSRKRKLSDVAEDTKTIETDPFIFEEMDPSKSRAIDSCLWEIQSLANHYSPDVATLVKSLFFVELKATVETKVVNPLAPLTELTHVTYKSLFEKEIKKGRKRTRVPLAFENRFLKSEEITNRQNSIFNLV